MRTFSRSIVCLILAVALLLSGAVAVRADDYITGTFTYNPSYAPGPYQDTFYYSDNYFAGDSREFDPHLLTMSTALACTMFQSGVYDHVTDLLTQIGFGDIEAFDMTEPATPDTIGTVIARKQTKDGDIVAVALRGGAYSNEWAGNVRAGADGNIRGFDEPKELVLARLGDYLDRYHISECSIWVTGYSRAGAVADLTGVYINEHPEEFHTSPEDLYVFCIEAPRCSNSDKVYNNIYCVVNKNDPIVYAYPSAWGIYRNGREIAIGEDQTIDAKRVNIISRKSVDVGDVDAAQFLQEFFDYISQDISRESYSEKLDNPVSSFIDMFMNMSSEKRRLLESLTAGDTLSRVMDSQTSGALIKDIILLLTSPRPMKELYMRLVTESEQLVDELTAQIAPMLSVEIATAKDCIGPLISVLGPLVNRDAHYTVYSDSSDPEDKGQRLMLYYLATFAMNFGDMVKNHYAQDNFERIKALDSFYDTHKGPSQEETSPEETTTEAVTEEETTAEQVTEDVTTQAPETEEETKASSHEAAEETLPAADDEESLPPDGEDTGSGRLGMAIASLALITAVAGMVVAGKVIKKKK